MHTIPSSTKCQEKLWIRGQINSPAAAVFVLIIYATCFVTWAIAYIQSSSCAHRLAAKALKTAQLAAPASASYVSIIGIDWQRLYPLANLNVSIWLRREVARHCLQMAPRWDQLTRLPYLALYNVKWLQVHRHFSCILCWVASHVDSLVLMLFYFWFSNFTGFIHGERIRIGLHVVPNSWRSYSI